jgi:hypothetical protein
MLLHNSKFAEQVSLGWMALLIYFRTDDDHVVEEVIDFLIAEIANEGGIESVGEPKGRRAIE